MNFSSGLHVLEGSFPRPLADSGRRYGGARLEERKHLTTNDESPSQPSLNFGTMKAQHLYPMPSTSSYFTTTTTMTTPGLPHPRPTVEIKLFVGRVPRSYSEEALRPVFEDFGQVGDIVVIRDRETGAHKGCAFVRMSSITQADAAIRSLNALKTLESGLGPLLVKYAQGEVERLGMPTDSVIPGVDQAKLFVGSLPKSVQEDAIQNIFCCFGKVDEIFIMRDENKQGKGCAFVRFALKEEAFHAIANLNGKYTMPGSTRAIEVRFAESKKHSSPTTTAAFMKSGSTSQNSMAPFYTANPHHHYSSSYHPYPSAFSCLTGSEPDRIGESGGSCQVEAASSPWLEYFTQDGRPYYHNTTTGHTQWEQPQTTDKERYPTRSHVLGSQAHGPLGANVFIFHIPNEWDEHDLVSRFQPYGQIVSARIATDKSSNRRLGFGFVSYQDVSSAVTACQELNGYSVSGKRLKVTIKRGEESHAACAHGPQTHFHAAHIQGDVISVSPTTTRLLPQEKPETPETLCTQYDFGSHSLISKGPVSPSELPSYSGSSIPISPVASNLATPNFSSVNFSSVQTTSALMSCRQHPAMASLTAAH